MTDQEIAKIKYNMNELLKRQIEIEKSKLQILRTYQSQVGASNDEYELKRIHDELAQMIGMVKPN